MLAETDLSGGLLREFVYLGSMRIARRDASGSVSYFFADHLGSVWLRLFETMSGEEDKPLMARTFSATREVDVIFDKAKRQAQRRRDLGRVKSFLSSKDLLWAMVTTSDIPFSKKLLERA